MRTRSKYGATRTTVDGVTFHSAKEARRYQELRLLERAGYIRGLKLQPKFPLYVKPTDSLRSTHALGIKVCDYIADFEYEESDRGYGGVKWTYVVEDTKGVLTPMYRLKRRMVAAQYNIQIREV